MAISQSILTITQIMVNLAILNSNRGLNEMDLLSIQRTWENSEFFEIEVIAQSELIRARVKSYTTEALINELASHLACFLQKSDEKYIWKNGTKGDNSTPFISLEFWREDRLGHIIVEVYMEIDDGTSLDRHNCCFYIRTESEALSRFGKSLTMLNEKGIGMEITL